MEMEDEEKIIDEVGKIDILKIGHHGYSSATSMNFAITMNPKNVIITNAILYSQDTIGALSYLQSRKNTNVYVTGNTTSDAIVVSYTSSGYSISPSDAKNANISISDTNGGLEKVGDAFWLYYENNVPVYSKWKQVDSYWYYFTNKGVMAKGWQKIDGKWYYLNPTTTSNIPEGAMVTGWQQVNGAWYYFSSTGAMVTGWNELTYENKKNWYYFESNGEMVTGWKQLENKWYYLNETANSTYPFGAMISGTCMKITDKIYCFTSEGVWDQSIDSEATIPNAAAYCQSLSYNGSNQTLTNPAGTGYTFSNNTGKDAGSYTVKASLKSNYVWSDSTRSDKTFSCTIGKANPTIGSINSPITAVVNSSPSINLLSNVGGTFSLSSSNNNVSIYTSSINVSANSTKSASLLGVTAGSSTITVKFTPSDTKNYNEVTKTVTVNIVNDVVYTLTIVPSGGVWNDKTDNSTFSLKKGDKINIPSPTRTGFTFKGWTVSNTSTSIRCYNT